MYTQRAREREFSSTSFKVQSLRLRGTKFEVYEYCKGRSEGSSVIYTTCKKVSYYLVSRWPTIISYSQVNYGHLWGIILSYLAFHIHLTDGSPWILCREGSKFEERWILVSRLPSDSMNNPAAKAEISASRNFGPCCSPVLVLAAKVSWPKICHPSYTPNTKGCYVPKTVKRYIPIY